MQEQCPKIMQRRYCFLNMYSTLCCIPMHEKCFINKDWFDLIRCDGSQVCEEYYQRNTNETRLSTCSKISAQYVLYFTWECPLTSTSSAKWTFTGLDLSLALFSGVMNDDFGPWEEHKSIHHVVSIYFIEEPALHEVQWRGDTCGEVEKIQSDASALCWISATIQFKNTNIVLMNWEQGRAGHKEVQEDSPTASQAELGCGQNAFYPMGHVHQTHL